MQSMKVKLHPSHCQHEGQIWASHLASQMPPMAEDCKCPSHFYCRQMEAIGRGGQEAQGNTSCRAATEDPVRLLPSFSPSVVFQSQISLFKEKKSLPGLQGPRELQAWSISSLTPLPNGFSSHFFFSPHSLQSEYFASSHTCLRWGTPSISADPSQALCLGPLLSSHGHAAPHPSCICFISKRRDKHQRTKDI